MAFPIPNSSKAAPSAYAIAQADSRDCPFCHGTGMITVYANDYTGSPITVDSIGSRHVSRTIAHCDWDDPQTCPLGTYLRSQATPDARRRIPRIQDVALGRSTWLLDDPTEEPLIDSSSKADKAAFELLWRQIREGRITKQVP